jgi:hypothetical protein
MIAEDYSELQVGSLGVESGCAKRLRAGICLLPISDEQMMKAAWRDDEAHGIDARGRRAQSIVETNWRVDYQSAVPEADDRHACGERDPGIVQRLLRYSKIACHLT